MILTQIIINIPIFPLERNTLKTHCLCSLSLLKYYLVNVEWILSSLKPKEKMTKHILVSCFMVLYKSWNLISFICIAKNL